MTEAPTAEDIERLLEWEDILDDSTYYEILDLLELADDEAVRASFKKFSLAFHPDMHLDAPDDFRDIVRRIFQRGAEAYRVLSDPALRADYDLAVAQGRLRLSESPPSRPRASHGPRADTDSTRPSGARSLEDVARTPAAKLNASKAEREINRGDFEAARRLLKDALAQDDFENPELEERIEGLDGLIFAKGR
jgi:curved DNA-binding protein CbpA